MEIQESKAVSVSNISPNANEKTVSDFFSFCGKISKLYMKKDEGADTSSAVVQFDTESAARTALLLTNALIIDRPITVSAYNSSPQPASTEVESQGTTSVVTSTNEVDESKITQRDFHVPDEQRSKTSVVASLLAAGYVLTNDAFDKAKEVDEKHSISLQAKVALEQVKVKAHEIDVQLGISEKAASLQKQASEKVKQIDEQLKISEKAKHAAATIQSTATSAANQVATTLNDTQQKINSKFEQVAANPTIAKGISTITTAANTVKSSVSTAYQDVKEQTQKAIVEKQKDKAGSKSPAEATTPPQQQEPAVAVTATETVPVSTEGSTTTSTTTTTPQ